MWSYNETSELYHAGVKGMKWGVRRSQNNVVTGVKNKAGKIQENHENNKDKLKSIAKNKKAHETDREIAAYASKSYTSKVAGSVTKQVVGELVNDALRGNFVQYQNRSQADWIAVGAKIAKRAATDIAINETMAVSVASKYNSDGTHKNGKSNAHVMATREQAALGAYRVGRFAYPYANKVAGMKYGQMKAERAKNEAKFNSWGGRILEAPVRGDIIDLNAHEYKVKDR